MSGGALSARLSLARTAQILVGHLEDAPGTMAAESETDIDPRIEDNDWGPARRIRFPLAIPRVDQSWAYPAGHLRSSAAEFRRAGRANHEKT